MIQQTLQVGGHQNVHAGRGGLEELPLCRISTGGEEVGQDVVLIGGADQLTHGQTHALGIVACQNVAEVARRHTEVHGIAEGDLAGLEQLCVSGKVVDDLRYKAAPVDGVCAGQANAPLFQLGGNSLVAKDLFHAGLGIVKVAAHGVDCHVGTLLGGHLQALDLAGAARGVEHRDFHTGDIVVTVQGCLAGVTAGGHQDQGLFGAAQILFGFHQQAGHQLQGVILEGTGGAMPQFQGIGVPFHRGKIARLAAKSLTVGGAGGLGQKFRRIIRQIFPDHSCGQCRIIQLTQGSDVHLRKALGNKQAALIGQALGDRLRRGHFTIRVSGTEELHIVAPFSAQDAQRGPALLWQSPLLCPYISHRNALHARKAPLIICTIQRPLSRGNTSATSNRTGASLRPFCCR